MQSWYCMQSLVIQWGTSLSRPFNVTNGVHQGGILSPRLFNIFINDLSVALSNVPYGCHVSDECFNHVSYADDSVLLATSPTALQYLIDFCLEYFSTHILLINVKKTKRVSILPKALKDLYIPSFFIYGNVLSCVTKECYLGVFMTSSDDDDEAIQKEIRALYARGNMLIRNFRQCTDDVKKQLFMSFCSSFYCTSLWTVYKRASLQALHVAHNNVLRLLFHLPRIGSISGHFVSQGIPNFLVLRRKLIYSMYKRVLSSQNTLIYTLANVNHFMYTRIYKEWVDTLF